MTIKEALLLHEDAPILLAHVLKKNSAFLFANPDKQISPLKSKIFNLLISRRRANWPVAYLTGHKEFFGLDFKVNKDVLIPRPETELLVELALPISRNSKFRNIIDIGTGSGNIIIALAKNTKNKVNFFAIDSSAKALRVAKTNAKKHSVAKKIIFLKGNLLSPITLNNSMELFPMLILANLPYLTSKQTREPSIKHEPRSALVAGKDGLKYYRELFKQLQKACHAGLPARSAGGDPASISLLIEFDPSQKQKIKALAKLYLAGAKIQFHKDLASKYRCAIITYGREN